VTLTFDLMTLKVVSESRVTWATSVPILVFLGLSVLDLGPMYGTDVRQTDFRQHHRLMPAGRGNNKLCGRPPQYSRPCKLTFDLLTLKLESGVRVTRDVGYFCENFSFPRPLCSRLRPDVRDRQTDVRRASSLNASALLGRGISIQCRSACHLVNQSIAL